MQVAVLTPSLPDREPLLRQAWDSVEAQTVPVEHLVALDEDREGPAVVRNWLATQTTAEFLLPLDDDDLLDPECVQVLVQAASGADIIYPWCRVEDHAPLDPWTPNRLYDADALMRYNYIPCVAMIRRDLWNEVGGMRSVPIAEDWDFWKRCLAAGAIFKCVNEVLWTYRRGLAGSRNLWI